MPNTCKNTIRVIGSDEAVSEVAMFLCQGHRIEMGDSPFSSEVKTAAALVNIGSEGTLQHINRDGVIEDDGWGLRSFGIEMLTHPDDSIRFILTVDVSSAWEPPSAALSDLSSRFPDVVIGVVYDESMNAVWGLDAYSAGQRFLQLEDDDFPVPDDWLAREAAADEEESGRLYSQREQQRNQEAFERLITAAGERLVQRQVDRAASIPERLRSHGWPRWGMLAHAAHLSGVEGLREALLHFEGVDAIYDALEKEYAGARDLGVASWMDTTLFGDETFVDDLATAAEGCAPYTTIELGSFSARQHELLTVLSQTQGTDSADSPLPHALLASLSNPDARLECGLHPAVFLTASACHSTHGATVAASVRAGLEALLAHLAKKTPRLLGADSLGQPPSENAPAVPQDELLRSVMAIAALPAAASTQLKPAIAAGIPPAFLLHTLSARTAGLGFANPDLVSHGAVLESLKGAYGSVSRFPAELVEEIERVGSSMSASLAALRTAEMMEEHIGGTTTASPASPPTRRGPRL